jgi:hypothetical protein
MKTFLYILYAANLSGVVAQDEIPKAQIPPPLVVESKDGSFVYVSTLTESAVVSAGGAIPENGAWRTADVDLSQATDLAKVEFRKFFPNWEKHWLLDQARRVTLPTLGRVYEVEFKRIRDESDPLTRNQKGIRVFVLYDGSAVPLEKKPVK